MPLSEPATSSIEDSDFQGPKAPLLRDRPCSATMAPIVSGSLLLDIHPTEEGASGGGVEICMGSGFLKESVRAPSIKPALSSSFQMELAMSSESKLLQEPSKYPFDEELSNDCNFGKNPAIILPESFRKETNLPSTARSSFEGIPMDQEELVSHPPVLSKRLSSMCLKAFGKLRSPSLSLPEYHTLSDCGASDTEIGAVVSFEDSYLGPPVSLRAPTDLGSSDSKYLPLNVTEDIECHTEPQDCGIRPSKVYSDATVITSGGCNRLLQEPKDIIQEDRSSLLKIPDCSPQPSLKNKLNNHLIDGTISIKTSSEASEETEELGGHGTQNKVITKAEDSHSERTDISQSKIDKMLDSSYQENPPSLEITSAGFMRREVDTYTGLMGQDKYHDFTKTNLEETPRKSRLTTWKEKAKIENWLRKKKSFSQHPPGQTKIPEVLRLKKSPSLLFRLWSSTVDSNPEEHRQNNCPQEATYISKQTISHPLEEVIATRVRKGREQVLRDASQLKFDDITNKVKRSGGSKRTLRQIFRENEPTVEDSPLAPLDSLSNIPPQIPSIGSDKQGGVRWNGAIQEFSGSLGQVCPSGKRSVSDMFRSGGIKPPSLELQAEFGAENSFQDSSLADDWHIAMRAMEEISSAELKLKRTGAVKHKRIKKGDTSSKSDVDHRKDGIGRSFSHEGGLSVADEKSANLVHDIMGESRDSDSDKSSMSPFTSHESLYKFLEFS
ncbi:hypothetical protein DFP73DRAFT_594559 [Morchella snyderi]|nr:hypothetical protein DFP73DRAFT_594559 [Morchella snyderi]